MPIYRYRCCWREIEVIQGIDKDTPLCPNCGSKMKKLPTLPAIVRITGMGGSPIRSKGYKEGYSKEYLKSIQET